MQAKMKISINIVAIKTLLITYDNINEKTTDNKDTLKPIKKQLQQHYKRNFYQLFHLSVKFYQNLKQCDLLIKIKPIITIKIFAFH